MATFKHDPVPQEFNWTVQWKNNLSKLIATLRDFLINPEFSVVTIDDDLVLEGNGLVEGAVEIEGDLSADNAAFGGEVTIGDDCTVGGFLEAGNSPFHLGPKTATAGTSVSFTAIPPWVRKITVMYSQLSLTGTDSFLIQIGSGTPETSGYTSASSTIADAANPNVDSSSSGFIIRSTVAGDQIRGKYEILLMDPATNLWVGGGEHYRQTSSVRVGVGAGEKSLSARLNILSVVATGANSFDNGSIALRCEY